MHSFHDDASKNWQHNVALCFEWLGLTCNVMLPVVVRYIHSALHYCERAHGVRSGMSLARSTV